MIERIIWIATNDKPHHDMVEPFVEKEGLRWRPDARLPSQGDISLSQVLDGNAPVGVKVEVKKINLSLWQTSVAKSWLWRCLTVLTLKRWDADANINFGC